MMDKKNKIDDFRDNWLAEIKEKRQSGLLNQQANTAGSSVDPSVSNVTGTCSTIKPSHGGSDDENANHIYHNTSPENHFKATTSSACENSKVKVKRQNQETANTSSCTAKKSKKLEDACTRNIDPDYANSVSQPGKNDVFDNNKLEQSGDDDAFNPFAIISDICSESNLLHRNKSGHTLIPPAINYRLEKTKYFKDNDNLHHSQKTSKSTDFACETKNSETVSQADVSLIDRDVSVSFAKTTSTRKKPERILDLFIADLDEITDIPFFDITLPKEVAINIFHHLDMKDLCRCAQVSRSWRAIAEDELLWCNLCHELGYDREFVTVEKSNWKELLRKHTERRRSLIMNWKNRSGKIEQLQHIKGGILSAVNSCDDLVVAGYTNGDCVLWNIETGSELCFRPSNCALVVNENAEEGTLSNYARKLAISKKHTAAAFNQGNIDIWHNDKGVEIIQSIQCPSLVTQLCLAESHPLLAFAHGYMVNVRDISAELQEGNVLNVGKMINDIKLVPTSSTVYQLAIWAENLISVCPAKNLNVDMNVIHNMIDSQVITFDVTEKCEQMAVGIGSYCEASRILMYDVRCGRLFSTLKSSGIWRLSCLNLIDSPNNCLVTGSTDKKVRLFDTRTDSNPISTLSGHSHQICTVQVDDWKVVAGIMDGFVCVWDRRMNTKLWELHNRHPVRHCKFTERKLVVGNIPVDVTPDVDEFETTMHRRYRGSIHYYDFEVDQTTQGVPDICSSTFDEPERYNYNIRLQMPYDKILF